MKSEDLKASKPLVDVLESQKIIKLVQRFRWGALASAGVVALVALFNLVIWFSGSAGDLGASQLLLSIRTPLCLLTLSLSLFFLFVFSYAAAVSLNRAVASTQIQRDMLSTVFESAPYIMLVIDKEMCVREVNRIGRSISLLAENKMLNHLGGQVIRCVNSLDGSGCGTNAACAECSVRKRVLQTFQTGESIREEEGRLIIQKDNNKVMLDLLISTALVKTKKDFLVLVTMADITRRKKAEEELREINATLENRVAERTLEVREYADRLRALAAELGQSEQRERKRLSLVLHDHIQQLLVAARIQIKLIRRAMNADKASSNIQIVDSLLTEAIEMARGLAVELSPPHSQRGRFD